LLERFNGAAPTWTRRWTTHFQLLLASGQLQWGRAHVDAEIRAAPDPRAPRCPRFNGAAPTWTRRCEIGAGLLDARGASMGPRPRGRGDASSCNKDPSNDSLQWGRAHVDAEMTTPVCLCAVYISASMGPRPRGRGDLVRGVDIVIAAFRFNGAAPTWTRRSLEKYSHTFPTMSFNGAAPTWTRRCRFKARTKWNCN